MILAGPDATEETTASRSNVPDSAYRFAESGDRLQVQTPKMQPSRDTDPDLGMRQTKQHIARTRLIGFNITCRQGRVGSHLQVTGGWCPTGQMAPHRDGTRRGFTFGVGLQRLHGPGWSLTMRSGARSKRSAQCRRAGSLPVRGQVRRRASRTPHYIECRVGICTEATMRFVVRFARAGITDSTIMKIGIAMSAMKVVSSDWLMVNSKTLPLRMSSTTPLACRRR